LKQLEYGAMYYDSDNNPVKLVVAILIWIVDHEEGNQLCLLYPSACRKCTRKTDLNGNWIQRTKEKTIENVGQMLSLWKSPGHKGDAYTMSKEHKQNIGLVYNVLLKTKAFES